MKRKTPWVKHCKKCGRFSKGGRPCADGRCKPHQVKNFNYIESVDIRQQKHYNQYKIQPITFIVENKLSFCAGNAVKYILRHKEKNGIEDLKKAKVYIDYMIEEIETGTVKP